MEDKLRKANKQNRKLSRNLYEVTEKLNILVAESNLETYP